MVATRTGVKAFSDDETVVVDDYASYLGVEIIGWAELCVPDCTLHHSRKLAVGYHSASDFLIQVRRYMLPNRWQLVPLIRTNSSCLSPSEPELFWFSPAGAGVADFHRRFGFSPTPEHNDYCTPWWAHWAALFVIWRQICVGA